MLKQGWESQCRYVKRQLSNVRDLAAPQVYTAELYQLPRPHKRAIRLLIIICIGLLRASLIEGDEGLNTSIGNGMTDRSR